MESYTRNQLVNIKRSARILKNTGKLNEEWYDVIVNLCDNLISMKEAMPNKVLPKRNLNLNNDIV